MPNYYQHNGTSYVHVSDYAALEARVEFLLGVVDAREARLAEEVKNKKEFERDWLAACDELCNTRSRLAEAEALLMEAKSYVYYSGDNLRGRINAFLAADSATHRENDGA